MRPSKRSLFVPAFACTRRAPSVSVRVQRGLLALPFVLATHLPQTRRPCAVCRNVSVTCAAWSTVKLNVVPTGTPLRFTGFGTALTRRASLFPSSHLPADCLTAESAAFGAGGWIVGAGAAAATVSARVLETVVP